VGPIDDPAPWDHAADALIDGPAGCWEVVGRASWDHDFGRLGGTRGDAVFAGRLVDGVWGKMTIWPQGEIVDRKGEDSAEQFGEEPRFSPMIGRVRGLAVRLDGDRDLSVTRSTDEAIEAVNTVRDLMDSLTADVETVDAAWDADADGVKLTRLAESRGADVRTEVLFPGGGLVPARWDVTIDGPLHKGLVKVSDFAVHLRGRVVGDQVLPDAEAVRLELHLAAFTVTARQTIVYTSVEECG
jgi:hypothetical protein